jgi:putative addiction module component (TIGR02574 family)
MANMSPNLDSLTSQALALPFDDRVELAQRLWQSLEGPVGVEDEFAKEGYRRESEMEHGTVQTFSHEDVMRDANELLGQ